ncbi:hypothetical protein Gohar_013431, partial [Gossypium harknessii]|nr:hypothetical protein [Gossypium harknessii]
NQNCGKGIAEWICQYLKELEGASVRKPTVVKGIGEWRPPVVLYVKFNFDATFNQSLNISSLGILVRDHRGEIIVSKTIIHKRVASPFTAEGLACLQALLLDIQLCFSSVTFEGDAKPVIKKCESNNSDRLEFFTIIYKIQQLKRVFHSISFRHVYRSASYLAHFLASGSLTSGHETYLLGGVLDFIADDRKKRRLREFD